MGFKAPRTVYLLDFEGTDLNGLEVKMRGGKLGDAFDTIHEVGKLAGARPDGISVADAELALSQYGDLADHLVSWNLTDDHDQPIKPDLDGLKTLEVRHVNMIAAAWQKAQVGVPGPLPSNLTTTSVTDLSLIRMEELPASLAS